MNRLDELVLALLDDGTLPLPEEAELQELLEADPANLAQAIQLVSLEANLRSLAPLGSVAESTLAQLRSARAAETDALADDVIGTIARSPVMRWHPAVRDPRRWLYLAGGAAAAAILTVLLLRHEPPAQSAPRPLMEAVTLSGQYESVTIISGDISRPAERGAALQHGDRVQASASGSVILAMDGGSTWLELEPESTLELGGTRGAPELHLHSGALSMQVAPRASNSPLRVTTDSAEATVMGTRFRLAKTPEGVWLKVTEGAVNFARPGGADALLVLAGHFALLAPEADLLPLRLPADGMPRLPLPLQFANASASGDAEWDIQLPQIIQRKVSRLPKYAERKGFNNTALASYIVGIPATRSVLLEARVRIDDALPADAPEAEDGFGVGVRIGSPQEVFRFRSIEDPSLQLLRVDLSDRSRASEVAEPRMIQFAHPPSGEWRLKFLARREEGGGTRLRGKFWPAGEAEPQRWQLDTTGPGQEPFTRIGVESTRIAVSWLELQASRVE